MQHVNWNIIRIPTFHFVSKVSQQHNPQCTGASSMRTKASGSPCCITKRKAMRRCDGRCGDAMDDEAMRWTMRRCDGRCGDAMGRCDGAMLPSLHRIAVHRIASSSIASHRLIVHRIASSSSRRRNASVTLLGHHTIGPTTHSSRRPLRCNVTPCSCLR